MRPAERQKEVAEETKQALRLQLDYQNLFSSPQGARVLKHMLLELGFFSPVEDEEQRILSNYGKKLVVRISGYNESLPDAMLSGILSLVNTVKEGD